MSSMVWKCGIAAVFFTVLHCVNEPPSKIHPVLNLTVEKRNDTARVLLSTTTAKQYSLYRVVDSKCTLKISYREVINGVDSLVRKDTAVANDPAAFQAGRFQGLWVVPDSLLLHRNVELYGCVSDETKHATCDVDTLP